MAIQSMQLDPNAQSYTDDEIVAKVNAATANITRSNACSSAAVDLSGKTTDDLNEGVSNAYDTGAPIPQLTDEEVIAAINSASSSITREDALSQDDLNIVKTNPGAGEFLVKNIHRDATGKLDIEYDDVAQ